MARKKTSKLSAERLRRVGAELQRQFSGLRLEDGAFWPALPRYLLYALVLAGVCLLAWFLWLHSVDEELQRARAQEPVLQKEYSDKLKKAVNLEGLKQRKAQVAQSVAVLEKQLPSKAEMDALLSDINQAGLGRSLQFDLFKPGAVVQRDYYAEQPIALIISGSYHDIGAFAGDVASLSRIVTLSDLVITPTNNKAGARPDVLSLHATARTYRYLDADEVAAAQASQPKAKPVRKK